MDRTDPETAPVLTGIRQIATGEATALLRARYAQNRLCDGLFARNDVELPDRLAAAADRRKLEYLAGRILARQALGATQAPMMGQDRLPMWPAGMTGSISHARGHVAVIVKNAGFGHVGVDIEALATPRGIGAILQKAAMGAERAAIAALAPDEMQRVATLLFSGKETLFKALFPQVGRHFGFSAARMRGLPQAGILRLELCESLTPALPQGMCFDLRYDVSDGAVLTWLELSA